MSSLDIQSILTAAKFAAARHRDQRRLDFAASPYIIHPLTVANELAKAGVIDHEVIMAGLLHDTIEDTETSLAELSYLFGDRVAGMVAELSDDKTLSKSERKSAQVSHAPFLSPGAALIKVADKISNVSDVTFQPPVGWDYARRLAYMDWAESVVIGCPVANDLILSRFNEVLATGREILTNQAVS